MAWQNDPAQCFSIQSSGSPRQYMFLLSPIAPSSQQGAGKEQNCGPSVAPGGVGTDLAAEGDTQDIF